MSLRPYYADDKKQMRAGERVADANVVATAPTSGETSQEPALGTSTGKALSRVVFSRATDEWRTPLDTFNALNAEFGFDHDAAATAENSWVDGDYFGPDHFYAGQRDALSLPSWKSYGRTFWLNPPYSKCRAFIAKAAQEARSGLTVVCLVPSRTDTRWWHSEVWDAENHCCRPGVEIRFIKGRLKFGNSENSAPFPSVVIVFRPPPQVPEARAIAFPQDEDGRIR